MFPSTMETPESESKSSPSLVRHSTIFLFAFACPFFFPGIPACFLPSLVLSELLSAGFKHIPLKEK